MIFYRTFPPNDGSADLSFSNRYTVDDQNFSLYISGVTPGDMRFRYQCELGVEDPQHPTTQGITYGLAATLELSLSIRSEWWEGGRERRAGRGRELGRRREGAREKEGRS